MTREETKKILMGIQCSYANFKPKVPLDFMIEIWTDDLAEYSYQQVYSALKAFKATNTSGFAPDVGQLIDQIHRINEMPSDLTEMEAWAKVRKAIGNSNYHASEEYERLDNISKALVGSPNQLRQWAMAEVEELETVIQSNFMRSYKAKKEAQKQFKRMPIEARTAIESHITEPVAIETTLEPVEEVERVSADGIDEMWEQFQEKWWA